MLALLSLHWKGIVVGLLIAGLLGGIAYWGHTKYVTGHQDGQIAQVTDDAAQYKTALAARDSALSQASSQLASATSQVQQYAALNATLASQLAAVKVKQTAAVSQVAAVPDSGLFNDVRTKLGQQPLTASSTYTDGELRAIDTDITSAPLLTQQVNLDTQSISALSTEVNLQKQQLLLTQQEVTAWQTYSSAVTTNYIECYNALPKHRNLLLSIVTLGIKGRAPKLALPKPGSLALPSLLSSSPLPASISH